MTKPDRLPPHSIESEMGLLGCILQSEDCVDEAAETMAPGAAAFYDLKNQWIYRAVMEVRQAGDPVSCISVHNHLKKTRIKDGYDAATLSYLMMLPEQTPSPVQLPYFVAQVLEHYQIRKMVQVCTAAAAKCMDVTGEASEAIETIEREVLDIRASTEKSRGVADLVHLHRRLLDKYEKAFQGYQTGLLTGFTDLDNLTGGMQSQDMIVLAGQQSTGKTSLAMNIVWNIAERGSSVGVLSLETSAEKLLHRLFASVGRVAGSRFLRASNLTHGEMESMMGATNKVMGKRNNILIDDSGGVSISQMKAKARRLRQRGAVALIVDYMQLLNVPGAGGDTERVTSISRAVKECAKENDCPVIGISSLNRDAAKGERKPRTSDLRGSGQIEYDGNQIWLLDSEDTESMCRTVKLKVAKNKDDGTGEVELMFFPAQFRFESAARVAKSDYPTNNQHND